MQHSSKCAAVFVALGGVVVVAAAVVVDADVDENERVKVNSRKNQFQFWKFFVVKNIHGIHGQLFFAHLKSFQWSMFTSDDASKIII